MPKKTIHVIFAEQSSSLLRAEQSVRTTFRLPVRSIQAITLLAKQLNVRQKTIFDHLMRELPSPELELISNNEEDPKSAKTFVLSRRTLDKIEMASANYQLPRDTIMEFAIERIMPLLKQEKEKHKKRKKLLEDLNKLMEDSTNLAEKSLTTLGQDDPVSLEIYKIFKTVENSKRTIETHLQKNERIEEF